MDCMFNKTLWQKTKSVMWRENLKRSFRRQKNNKEINNVRCNIKTKYDGSQIYIFSFDIS